jgi:hypothetical protein
MSYYPHFLSQRDPDWGHFTREQADAIVDLRLRWAAPGLADRYHAGVTLLRDDGANQIVPLTVDLVEPHAHRYWRHERNEAFVLSPLNESGPSRGWQK